VFVIDDIAVLAGAGLLVLVVVSVRAVRRRRLNKKLAKDKEFRAKVSEALDESDIDWIKQDVGATDHHIGHEHPPSRASSPIDIPIVKPVERTFASVPDEMEHRPVKKKRHKRSESVI
jgi:hypothetical protein